MNKHEYTLFILANLAMEFEKCAQAANNQTILNIENDETKQKVLASIFALCSVQDEFLSKAIQRERILLERGEE